MFTVYAIQSQTTRKLYIGQTEDLDKRLKQHNDKDFDKRSFTKLNGRDWIVVYEEACETRREAMMREKELKSFRGREFIKNRILGR